MAISQAGLARVGPAWLLFWWAALRCRDFPKDPFSSTVEAVVDLGNGTERVTIRSAQPQTAAGVQFLRIRLKIP